MTLFYEEDTDSIIENHPDFAEFDDEDRLVLDLTELGREEKRKSLLNAAAAAVEASDEYDLVTDPEVEWTGGN
ncbi:hypothetical protein [Natrinema sp. DC36]|uniref:hypothetical protein n=1 Tax=Natrinema sp. DC36 TaxID=2878680 RepID=UPI001CF0A763|nr:hypothetical protein [Natrinema sp. DC36]